MIIHQSEIISAGQEVRLQARVETRASNTGLPEFLWFSYPKAYAEVLSTRADSPLAALVLVAMALGEDLECRGEASPRLIYNLSEYQRVFYHWQPHLFKKVGIHAENITPPMPNGLKAGYATTFSSGVDSFFTIHQMLTPSLKGPQWPLKYALFLQESPDLSLPYQRKFEYLAEKFAALAQELNLDCIPVRTNLMRFAANRIAAHLFLEAPLVGAALGLSPILAGMVIPSGRMYDRYKDAAAGPMTTYLIATEAFEVISHGGAFPRFGKTQAISNWKPAQENLRVCLSWHADTDVNCSCCSECLRTRMDLQVIGRLEKFTTLKSPFKFKDLFLWGSQLEFGFSGEKELLDYAWKQRKEIVPGILLGVLIGFPLHLARKYFPNLMKKSVVCMNDENDPHDMFDQYPDNPENRAE